MDMSLSQSSRCPPFHNDHSEYVKVNRCMSSNFFGLTRADMIRAERCIDECYSRPPSLPFAVEKEVGRAESGQRVVETQTIDCSQEATSRENTP